MWDSIGLVGETCSEALIPVLESTEMMLLLQDETVLDTLMVLPVL
jgi:hypothetical protein